MEVTYHEVYGQLNEIIVNAKKAENAATEYDVESSMESIRELAEQMKDPLEGLRSGEDVEAAIRQSEMPRLQKELGEHIMSVMAGSGFPTDPNVREPFKTLLNAAKNVEEQVSQVEGVSERTTLRQQ